MDERSLLELHEKFYFHEINMRDSLNGRLQTPLAIIVAFIGAITVLLQGLNKESSSVMIIGFWVLVSIAGFCLGISIYYFIRSWFNHEYEMIPSPKDLEDYRNILITHYSGDANQEDSINYYMKKAIYDYYVNCTTTNALCNEKRSFFSHRTNASLIITSIFAFLAFLAFYFGSLDKSATEIIIVKPIKIESVSMATTPTNGVSQSPPSAKNPPPAPPSVRILKEGFDPRPQATNKKTSGES